MRLEFLLWDMPRSRTFYLNTHILRRKNNNNNNNNNNNRYSNRFLDATVVSMYLILQPVSTAFLSLILDINVKTSTSWSLWVSMVLIFIGLYITTSFESEVKKKKMQDSSSIDEPLLEEGSHLRSSLSSASSSSIDGTSS